jgi:N-acetylglutamate synthase-like GNAT family acetyltransferase
MRHDPKRKDFSIRKMVIEDVPNVRELSRAVWADQLFKDTGIEVEYPAREMKVYAAYVDNEPDGNLVAEVEGRIVAASYAHTWGSVGWIGPVEVVSRWQGNGIGTELLRRSSSYLESRGCRVIGVETMGDSEKNVSFYGALDYSITSPTFVYEKVISKVTELSGLTEELPADRCERYLPTLSSITDSIFPGMDLRKEFRMAMLGGIGKVLVARDAEDRVIGASIVHERTVEGLSSHLMRALIVDPDSESREKAFSSLVNDSEVVARGMGARKLFFTSSVSARSVTALSELGYQVIGNNVKMLMTGDYSEKGDFQLISWAG